jgi:hypothetical protein
MLTAYQVIEILDDPEMKVFVNAKINNRGYFEELKIVTGWTKSEIQRLTAIGASRYIQEQMVKSFFPSCIRLKEGESNE